MTPYMFPRIVISLCTIFWVHQIGISSGGFACLSNPCIFGICMDDINSSYSCYCIDGYTGIQCQTNWDECWSSPCQNGGTCIDGIATYNCTCPPGFNGPNCDVNINECASNPCANNGTCLDLENGFDCDCAPGYLGDWCEIDISVCNETDGERCANGGLCVDGPGWSFECKCLLGWSGVKCELEVNECDSGPCQNGGVCIDLIGDYQCACHFGYTGKSCEAQIEICSAEERNPCENEALCLMEENDIICYCVPDFHGDKCQYQYDECQLGPKCLNGGTCIDGIDTFTCSCPPDLTGVLCECLIMNDTVDCTYIRTTREPEMTEPPTEPTSTVPNYETSTIPIIESTTEVMIYSTETSTLDETTSDDVIIESTVPITESWGTSSTYLWTTEVLTPEPIEITIPTFFTTEFTEIPRLFPSSTTEGVNDTIYSGDGEGSTDCTKIACENGGTCMSTTQGSRCICPFDVEGPLCNVDINIQTPAFSGDSYLTHELSSLQHLQIEFMAKTLSSSGLIFFWGSGPQKTRGRTTHTYYMTLYIADGFLKFEFSCGIQTMVLSEMKIQVNNGYEMKVQALLDFTSNFTHCNATVKVNSTITMSGDQMATWQQILDKKSWLHFGNTPQDYTPFGNAPSSGFIGCIHSLHLNNIQTNLFKNAVDGFEITECDSLACLSGPCMNGGTCVNVQDGWKCACRNGYLGSHCQHTICDTNPCLYGATCLLYSDGWMCLCPFGKHGLYCEEDLDITCSSFSSTISTYSSFVTYPLPHPPTSSLQISLQILPATLDQISLILYLGQVDHLSLSFIKGYIMLTWNLGSGPRRIFTTSPLTTLHHPHKIELGLQGRRGWLRVNQQLNITGRSPGTFIQLNIDNPILYVGGYSGNFTDLPHDLPLHFGFSGCIFNVEVGGGQMLAKPMFGRSVGQCKTIECSEGLCQNGGACLQHGPTFTCLCADGWFGEYCTVKYNPCDEMRHNCSAGSTCVPKIDGFQCDCPFGRTGESCEKVENYSDFYFSGKRSYLQLQDLEKPTTPANYFNIDLEIRPLNSNGQIFFSGFPMDTSDLPFLSLYLQGGILEFRVYSPGELTIIRSHQVLRIGEWHQIRIGHFGRRLYLWTNQKHTSKINNIIPSRPKQIMLGGLPDLSTLPKSAAPSFPTPFHGCLRKFRINSRTLTPIRSRNIGDCDGTPCGGELCLNGGTCWLDTTLEPHCTCSATHTGIHCQDKVSCLVKMCQNKGHCQPSGECNCQFGFTGDFCEEKLEKGAKDFWLGGHSYISLNEGIQGANKLVKNGVDVEYLFMNFSTVLDGMLVWSQKDEEFLGIGVENGFIKLVWASDDDHNSEFLPTPHILTLDSAGLVSDGTFHNLTFLNLDENVKFYVDGVEQFASSRVPYQNASLKTNGVFYIGGFSTHGDRVERQTQGLFHQNFIGCIHQIQFDDKLQQNFTNLSGENIAACNLFKPNFK